MTKEQEKEVIRVLGPDYEKNDIPAIWRSQEIEVEDPDDMADVENEK